MMDELSGLASHVRQSTKRGTSREPVPRPLTA